MALTPEQIKQLQGELGHDKPVFQPMASSVGDSSAPALNEKPRGVLSTLKDVGIGAIKGVGSTLLNTASLGAKPFDYASDKLFGVKAQGSEMATDLEQEYTQPKGTAQKIGFGAEKIAEFLVPSSKIAKAQTGMKLLPKIGTEIGANVGVRTLQTGNTDDAKTTAIVSALFPTVGAGLSATKGVLKPIGQKIQQTVIRPSGRDMADGFKIENITKYGLGGSLENTAVKVHTTLNKYSRELADKLKNSNAAVNLNKVYQDTLSSMSVDKAKSFGDIGATKRILESLKSEIEEVAGKNGLVDLVEATNIKRGAGTKGSWAFGRVEPDAGAVEKVYSAFYSKLKEAIEVNAPKEVADINKKLSELIPISNAVIRRLPVEQRNNVISLTDSIGLFSSIFDPRALALVGANKLSKSGKFGQFLVNVAERTPKTSIGKRIFKANPQNTK